MGGHFPVSVISQNREDVERLLAPYQENNMDTCPKEYLTFMYAEREYEKEERSRVYATFYDFVDDHGYVFDMAHGAYGRWENLDAKWDYYQIGGQFDGLIPLKNGSRASCCRIGEVDMQKSEADRNKALRYWDENIAPESELDNPLRERHLTCYGNRNNYADKHSRFATGALVTPDGIWREIGKNGKLSETSSFSKIENYYYFFLKTLEETDPGYWLTVVDCHI